MNLVDKNLELLKENHREIYENLSDCDLESEALSYGITLIENLETREEISAIVVTKDGTNIRLNSPMRPLSEASRWAEQFKDIGAYKVATFFGFGNGLFARKLLELLPKSAKLIIVEPLACMLDFAIKNYDISDILADKRVELILCSKSNAFKDKLSKILNYNNMKTAIHANHPQYDKLSVDDFVAFKAAIMECEDKLYINKNTLLRFGKSASINTLKNLKIMKDASCISALSKTLPTNIPVIIVSAGPSLDNNIELLRKAKGKSLIICVDTAIKYMLSRDIIPDLTIVIEPEKPVENYADKRSLSIPLICDIEANPEIVLAHESKKIIFNIHGFLKRLLKEIGINEADLGSGGSVATAAFALCYQLNMKKVILIGQDLAYTGEATHAGGVVSAGLNKQEGNTFVEDVFGNPVRTRGDWLTYLKWFENSIAAIAKNEKDMEIIDATEGGAKIKGTTIMTFEEAIEKYCNKEYLFEEELKNLLPILDGAKYSEFKEKAKESKNHLEIIKNLAAKGLEYCNNYSIENNKEKKETTNGVISEPYKYRKTTSDVNSEFERYQKTKKENISKINAQLEQYPIYKLINDYSLAKISDELDKINNEEGNSFDNQTRLAYQTIIETCEYFNKNLFDFEK